MLKWFTTRGQKKCPTCSALIRDMVPGVTAISILDDSLVYCENKAHGGEDRINWRIDHVDNCPWTGPFSSRKAHMQVCQFSVVTCDVSGCQQAVMRRDLQAHRNTCPQRIVECPRCKQRMKALLVQHHEGQCALAPITCSLCCEALLLHQLPDHKLVCVNRIVQCPYAGRVGCPWTGPFHTLDRHQHDAMADHLQRAMSSQATAARTFTWTVDELDSKLLAGDSVISSDMPIVVEGVKHVFYFRMSFVQTAGSSAGGTMSMTGNGQGQGGMMTVFNHGQLRQDNGDDTLVGLYLIRREGSDGMLDIEGTSATLCAASPEAQDREARHNKCVIEAGLAWGWKGFMSLTRHGSQYIHRSFSDDGHATSSLKLKLLLRVTPVHPTQELSTLS